LHIFFYQNLQKLLLEIWRKDPTMTQKAIAETTSLSQRTVQRIAKELSESGRLEHVGSRKSGHWIVHD
jgi:predicted HTH transcriptional regulator